MHTATRTTSAPDNLRTIIQHWTHLRALTDTATPHAWRPTPHTTEPRGREELVLPETPTPVRLHVVDACTAIETALCEAADEIAADVQRPVVTAPRPDWPAADRHLRSALADHDAADPRRWHYTRTGRTAPRAAAWLLDRLLDTPGICAPITDAHRRRIADAAAEAAGRIARTIGADYTADLLPDDRPCPWCGGVLVLRQGITDAPVVTCGNGYECGAPVPVRDGVRIWSTPHQFAELQHALDTAEYRRRRAEARRRQRAAAAARAMRGDAAA